MTRAQPPRGTPPTLETIPGAIAANIAEVRGRTDALIMAVVKADGYGHGAITVGRAAIAAGADWLGTTSTGEAIALRDAGLTAPILTWLHPSGLDVAAAVRHDIDLAIGSRAHLEEICASDAVGVRIHLNMDTGMAREGNARADWRAFIIDVAEARRRGRVRVTGVMGHLPLADRAEPLANAAGIAMMRDALDLARRTGLPRSIAHLAATSAALTDPATHFDMVRVGAGLVGIDPSGTIALHPASRLTAPVVHTRRADAGVTVGYGETHRTTRATHLAVLPIGYADGIPRDLATDAHVSIEGRPCRIVGRVSMDQIVVDTGDDAVPHGSIASVFGPEGGTVPTVDDWARWAGTIPHTIVTGIGARVSRRTP